MTVSTSKVAPMVTRSPGTRHPTRELSVAFLFGPLADRIVRLLLPLRMPPPAVVLVHTALGLYAAYLVHEGSYVLAALLLQAKTLLDNVDGRLARASGRADLVGRYLDTEADLLVNAALFLALGQATGRPWLAVAGLVAVTLLLSADFNAAAQYREAQGAPEPTARSGGLLERVLAGAYAVVFAPQDRALRAISDRRLARVVHGEEDAARRHGAARAYHDRATVGVLANLGLSTQLLVLGVLLALRAPVVYLWLVVGALALLPALQLRRELLARRALR